jgi:hypothetical protein
MTAHAFRRLEERIGLSRLKQTPFDIHTLYCEASDIDRPVWAFRVSGPKGEGFLLGRWEVANPQVSRGQYEHWFVATTAITTKQFNYSKLSIKNAIGINVVRVTDERILIARREAQPKNFDTSFLTMPGPPVMLEA